MTPLISLPSNFVASTTAYMGQLFTDLSSPITLIVGILAASLVIDIIFSIVRHK